MRPTRLEALRLQQRHFNSGKRPTRRQPHHRLCRFLHREFQGLYLPCRRGSNSPQHRPAHHRTSHGPESQGIPGQERSRLAVEDDVREIPEGVAYRVVLDPTAAEPEPQEPRGAGTNGDRLPLAKKPKFIWIPISLGIIVTVWGVHEALESPDRP